VSWPYAVHLISLECWNTTIQLSQAGDVLRYSLMSCRAPHRKPEKPEKIAIFEPSLGCLPEVTWNSAAHIGQAMSYSEPRLTTELDLAAIGRLPKRPESIGFMAGRCIVRSRNGRN
jgi:hypothetical protein